MAGEKLLVRADQIHPDVIANQQDVLAAVQRLRKRAKDAGNL